MALRRVKRWCTSPLSFSGTAQDAYLYPAKLAMALRRSREDRPDIDCAAALRALNEVLSIPACRILSHRAIDDAAQQASSESNQQHHANLLDAESYFDAATCPAQVEENASIVDCRDLLDGLTVQPLINEQSGSAVQATLARLRIDVWHGANIGDPATLCRTNAVPNRLTATAERKDHARDKSSDNMIRLRGLFRAVAYLKVCIERAKFNASPAGKISRSIDTYCLLHSRQVVSVNGYPAKATSTLPATKNKKQTNSKKALMRMPAGSPPPPPRSMTARQKTYGATVLFEATSIFQPAIQNNDEHVQLQCTRAAHAFWNRVCQRAVHRAVLTFIGRINLHNEGSIPNIAVGAIHQTKPPSLQHERVNQIRTASRCGGADLNEARQLFTDKREELEWRQKVERRLNVERVQLSALLDDTGWMSINKLARQEAKLIKLPAQNVGSPVLEVLRRYATKNLIRCTPTVRSVLEMIYNSREHSSHHRPIRRERLVTHQQRQHTILPINGVRTTCTDIKAHESCEHSHTGDISPPRRTTLSENGESPTPLRDSCSDYDGCDGRVPSLKPQKPRLESCRHGQRRHPHRDLRERQDSKSSDGS